MSGIWKSDSNSAGRSIRISCAAAADTTSVKASILNNFLLSLEKMDVEYAQFIVQFSRNLLTSVL